MEKQLRKERADRLSEIEEQVSGPIEAKTLQTPLGGNGPGLIDAFFSSDDEASGEQ
jgi:hypothetical protein